LQMNIFVKDLQQQWKDLMAPQGLMPKQRISLPLFAELHQIEFKAKGLLSRVWLRSVCCRY
jgi:hypothetical protein